VQWHQIHRQAAQGELCGGDLRFARQEHQHIAGCVQGAHHVGDAAVEITRVRQGLAGVVVADVHRVQAAVGLQKRAAQVRRDPWSIERRAHGHELGLRRLHQEREQEIHVEPAFVQLVEDHRRGVLQCVHLPQRDARRDEADHGVLGDPVLGPHLVADAFSERAAFERRDPRGQRAAGHSAWLHHHHRSTLRRPARHLGALAAAGRRGDHDRAARGEVDLAQRVDGQVLVAGAGYHSVTR
jgi:hypothetical protein